MRARILPAVLVIFAGAAAGASDPALRALFPSEVDVFVERTGLARIDLPADVLAACRGDLSNVRLFEPDGNEVPFLLDVPRRGAVHELETFDARTLELRREEVHREGRPNLRREIYEVSGPGHDARNGGWNLVFDVARPAFVAEVEVRPSGTPRSGHGKTGTIFRIETPRRTEKLRVPAGASAAGRFEVVIQHDQPSWLEPSMRFESASSLAFGQSTSIPLEVLSTTSVTGTTTIEVARRRGIVPEALRIETTTGTFDRAVEVRDAGPGRDTAPLARGRVFRVLPGTGVEELELTLRPARGDRLRIVIDDAGSPPLESPSIVAVFSRPSLVASLTAAGDSVPSAVLRFGGSRALAPRYDLEGLRVEPGREVYGRRAEALVRLYDPESIVPARLGAVRANPDYDASPTLAFAARPGASIDLRLWKLRRALEIGPTVDGLTRVRLGPEDLARLRPDLADLRVADGSGRQWPYLVDPNAGVAEVRWTLASSTSKGKRTTYDLEPTIAPVLVDRLSIESDEPFFDRPFTLSAETDDGTTTVLAEGRLVRPARDFSPIVLETKGVRVRRLELRIENGDDAPLRLRNVRATAPVPDVFVVAPPGSYWVMLGSEDAKPASYEIERARDVVLALGAEERLMGPLDENPAFRAAARFARGEGREKALLWGAILVAVVVLAALTLRLAQRGTA